MTLSKVCQCQSSRKNFHLDPGRFRTIWSYLGNTYSKVPVSIYMYMYHCSLFTMFRLDQNDYLLSGKFKQYSGRRWRYRNTIEFWMDISGSGLDLGVLFHSGHVSTWKLSRHLDCNRWVKWEKVLSNIFVFSSLINLQ